MGTRLYVKWVLWGIKCDVKCILRYTKHIFFVLLVLFGKFSRLSYQGCTYHTSVKNRRIAEKAGCDVVHPEFITLPDTYWFLAEFTILGGIIKIPTGLLLGETSRHWKKCGDFILRMEGVTEEIQIAMLSKGGKQIKRAREQAQLMIKQIS